MADWTAPATRDHQAARPGARLPAIDTIRSVALFGVIVMNTLAVTMVIASKQVMASASALDMAIGVADFIFLQGKARACFALLFGVGFGLLLARMPDTGAGYPRFYLRRLATLFLFGLINQAFLFWGDILAHYAVLGLALPLCRRWSDRTLLRAGAGLIILPPALFALGSLALGAPLPNLAGEAEQSAAYLRESTTIYAEGSYLDVVARNIVFQPRAYWYDSVHRLESDLSLLGLFLLGLLAARMGMATHITAHRAMLARIARWCLPVGAAISLIFLAKALQLTSGPILQAIGMAAFCGPSILALGMVAWGALALESGGLGVQRWLAPAGRMALTNYLLSGLIASWVTYGFGLGMLGRMNLAELTMLGAGIYGALALFSRAWLSAFRIGPAEWLLRCATYARRQPFRRPGIAQPDAALASPRP